MQWKKTAICSYIAYMHRLFIQNCIWNLVNTFIDYVYIPIISSKGVFEILKTKFLNSTASLWEEVVLFYNVMEGKETSFVFLQAYWSNFPETWNPGVLVCSGCHGKIPEWFKQQKFISRSSGGWSPISHAGWFSSWWEFSSWFEMASFLLSLCMAERGIKSSG